MINVRELSDVALGDLWMRLNCNSNEFYRAMLFAGNGPVARVTDDALWEYRRRRCGEGDAMWLVVDAEWKRRGLAGRPYDHVLPQADTVEIREAGHVYVVNKTRGTVSSRGVMITLEQVAQIRARVHELLDTTGAIDHTMPGGAWFVRFRRGVGCALEVTIGRWSFDAAGFLALASRIEGAA